MTFEEVPVQSPVLDLQGDLMGISGPRTYSGRMTGFNGSLLYLPIRSVLLVISLAHVTQLMDATTFFNIPKMVKYATLIAAIFLPVYAIVSPVFYPGITPNWGPYVALIASGREACLRWPLFFASSFFTRCVCGEAWSVRLGLGEPVQKRAREWMRQSR